MIMATLTGVAVLRVSLYLAGSPGRLPRAR
jgi:hypothetical protein